MDSIHVRVHVVCFANTNSFDSYLYGGWHYPPFPQLDQLIHVFESGTYYKNTYKLGSGHLTEGTLTGCTMQNAKTNDHYSLT